MNLFSKATIKKLLRKHHAAALKRLSQNFLIRPGPVKDLVALADLRPNDVVLEPGPGLGSLTYELANRVKRVVAVEKDKKMAKILTEVLKEKGVKNVVVIEGDILTMQKSKIKNQNENVKCKNLKTYKLVGNLPFSVGTAIVRRFLEVENPPQVMAVILQKEVAERICAQPPHMSRLSVFCQFYGLPQFIKTIPQNAFWPQPKMAAAILKVLPNPLAARKSTQFKQRFAKIVRAGFSHKRKQIGNNLASKFNLNRSTVENWLLRCSIHPTQRAETLRLTDWLCLAQHVELML